MAARPLIHLAGVRWSGNIQLSLDERQGREDLARVQQEAW